MSEGPDYDDAWAELSPTEKRDELVGCGCLTLFFLLIFVILVTYKI